MSANIEPMLRIVMLCVVVSTCIATLTLVLVFAQYLGRIARTRRLKRELSVARARLEVEIQEKQKAWREGRGGRAE